MKEEFTTIYQDRLDRLSLYGSYARGTADQGSDIDIAVVLKGDVDSNIERKRTLNMITDISLENDVVISCLFIDVSTFSNKQDSLYRNIRREGISL